MRVLHVDTARTWRGGQTQLRHLLAARPDDAVALPGDAALRADLPGGTRVFPVAFRAALRGTWGLGQAIRAFQPDVIAAHTSHAHSQAVRVAGGRPVIVHRRLDFQPRGNPLSRLEYRLATGFVAVSHAVSQVLQQAGVPPERIAVVHDGVDPGPLEAALPLELDAPGPRVLAVGALVPHKGQMRLIEAMAHLGGTCFIAGEGPLRDDLVARAELLGVSLVLLGQIDDVPRWLKSVDVFCHPSTEEGLGQVVLEAVIAGVPVVTSGAGGLAEIPGTTAAPASDPRALAEALRIARPPGQAARDEIRTGFSVSAMTEATRAAYERLPCASQ